MIDILTNIFYENNKFWLISNLSFQGYIVYWIIDWMKTELDKPKYLKEKRYDVSLLKCH